MIHSSNLPLFSDLSAYNRCASTKAGVAEEDSLLSLESLLDRSRKEEDDNGIYHVTSVPFREAYSSGNVSITSESHPSMPVDSLSSSQMFFVRTYCVEDNFSYDMVVTMIPDVECQERMAGEELSYIDKSKFSGLLLYSTPDGIFLESLYVRYSVPLAYAVPVTSESSSDTVSCGGSIYLSTGRTVPGTKAMKKVEKDVEVEMKWEGVDSPSGDGIGGEGGGEPTGGTLDECVIEADGTSWTVRGYLTYLKSILGRQRSTGGRNGSGGDWGTGPGGGGGGGGGSYSSNASTSSSSKKNKQPLDSYTYTVVLGTNGTGYVIGAGTYVKGQQVNIYAVAEYGHYFFKWSGDLEGRPTACSFPIRSNIYSTAVFLENTFPCYDAKTGLMNPLVIMEVAPTNSGNLSNGRFFNNGQATANMDRYLSVYARRDNKRHQGMDLAGEEGTPIYAPCDGYISETQAFVTEQPDRDPVTKKYTDPDYTGDVNDAGNRFYLECEVSGMKVAFAFWHLQAGNAVADNPRTGAKFKPGDLVYQGEEIGYIGRTGNAYNVSNTHLHFGVKNLSTGKWMDPEDFINGRVNEDASGYVYIDDTAIIDINCNSAITK